MRTNSVFRFFLLGCAVSLIVGCKVAVIVVEGGEVQSIGAVTCLEGTICMVEVNDTNFSASFTAVPNPGWHFVKWNKGWGLLCGDSTNPTCVVSTVGTAGNTSIEAIIASDKTFSIMPVFEIGLDTVTVAGKEWAQVDLFTNLSWNQINAVCPEGVCTGILNGYDMTGLTWASIDDINALFNYYIGSDILGPGPDIYHEFDSEWAPAFFGDGWRSLDFVIPDDGVVIPSLEGWLRNLPGGGNAYVGLISIGVEIDELPNPEDSIGVSVDEFFHKWDYRGGWFYRTP
jgi:hypothetical protein